MFQNRCRDGNAVFFFKRLAEAGDRHVLQGEGNVEREMFVTGPSGNESSSSLYLFSTVQGGLQRRGIDSSDPWNPDDADRLCLRLDRTRRRIMPDRPFPSDPHEARTHFWRKRRSNGYRGCMCAHSPCHTWRGSLRYG
jgi:hypothetical protein